MGVFRKPVLLSTLPVISTVRLPSEVEGGGACTLNGTTGCGTFFELQKSGAKWVEKAVRLDGKNGANPQAGVILGKNGEVFGTTLYGGTGSCQGNLPGCGVVFELIP